MENCRDYPSIEVGQEKTCHMRTTKAQIRLCIHSLISTFVLRFLDSTLPLLAKSKILNRLWADQFESYLVTDPLKTGFLVTWLSYHKNMLESLSGHIWALSREKQQNDLCTQWRLRSAWASAQSDQSLRCPHKETLGPWLPIQRKAKTMIRLGTQLILLVFLWDGSFENARFCFHRVWYFSLNFSIFTPPTQMTLLKMRDSE